MEAGDAMLVGQDQAPVDGEGLAGHGEVVEREIAILALSDIEIHGRFLPRRLAPSDRRQENIRVREVGLHEKLRRPVFLHGNRERDGEIAFHNVIDVQAELVAALFAEDGGKTQRGLLLRRRVEDPLPCQRNRDVVDLDIAAGADRLVRDVEIHRAAVYRDPPGERVRFEVEDVGFAGDRNLLGG